MLQTSTQMLRIPFFKFLRRKKRKRFFELSSMRYIFFTPDIKLIGVTDFFTWQDRRRQQALIIFLHVFAV
jgi:hypothetical protein